MQLTGRALLVVMCALAGIIETAGAGPLPRVRGVDGDTAALVRSALARSPTVRELAAQLDSSDVIAYVQLSAAATRTASTALLDSSGPMRYLLVSLNPARPAEALLELLAHELQHVVEIARAREVRSDAALVRLYRRIGLSRTASNRFETAAAQEISRKVRRELSIDAGAAYARDSAARPR